MKWLLIVLATTAQADIAKPDWALSKGKLTYHVNFPLKKFEGVSENLKGKGHCEADTCEFLIGSPVKSFDSGDGNRDNHMLEVTKAGLFPVLTARISFPKSAAVSSFTATAEIVFGGQTHKYEVPVKGRVDGNATVVSGIVPLKLSDFKMERPSLLGVRIDDAVPVDFELRWE
jgi:hypothetical protein